MISDFDSHFTTPALVPQLAQVKQQTGQVLLARYPIAVLILLVVVAVYLFHRRHTQFLG